MISKSNVETCSAIQLVEKTDVIFVSWLSVGTLLPQNNGWKIQKVMNEWMEIKKTKKKRWKKNKNWGVSEF